MTVRPKERFPVINGEAMPSRIAVRRDLVVVGPRPVRMEQLALAGWASAACRERVLSVGFDSLDFHSFRRLLLDTGVRHVFDVRHLASFRGRGFSPALAEATFRELGVSYQRCVDLANEHVGSSPNQELVLQRYATRLRAEPSATLRHIAECALRAPLLLLGREPAHFGTEREVLVELLAERQLALEVVAAVDRAPFWRWTSFLLGTPGTKRDTPAPRPPTEKRSVPKQLPLLEPPNPQK